MLKKLNISKRLLITLSVLTCLFFVNCFWQGMMWIVFPALMLFCLTDSLENGFTYVLFTLPYFLMNGSLGTILYFSCILAFIIKFYIVLFFVDKVKLSKKELILMGLLLLYVCLPFGKYNLNWVIKFFLIIFVIVFINAFSRKRDLIRLDFNIRIVAISLLISCLMSFTYIVSPWMTGVHPLAFLDGELLRFCALYDNVNVLAMVCEILLSMLAYLIITNKKVVDWILFVLCAGFGLLTFSKTYILLLCLLLFILFCYYIKKHTIKTIVVSVIVVCAMGLVYVIVPEMINNFINRFVGIIDSCNSFADYMNMITTDRYSIWILYLQHLFNNPLHLIFGAGLGAPRLNLKSSHNAFISMIYQLGILGVVLLITTIVIIIKNGKNKNKFNKAFIIPLLILGLILSVEDMIFFILNIA